MGRIRLRQWTIVSIVGGIGTGALAGCGLGGAFACQSDAQCGAQGVCEAAGVCSFPAAACPSGRRYANHAGDLSGNCVPEEIPGTSDASGPPTTASPSTSTTDSVTTAPAETTTAPVIDSSSSGIEDGTSTGVASSASTGEPISRVEDGLLVLYRFTEGAGDTVADVSTVDPPMDLTLQGDGFDWTPAGLAKVGGESIAIHEGSASKILHACQESNELTVEAWVTSAAPDQIGPARIVTYSLDADERHFTLGEGTGLDPKIAVPGYSARLRTTDGTINGAPYLLHEGDVATAPTHVLFTRDASGLETLYLDAEPVATQMVKVGTFENWDPDTSTFKLAVGNELTLDRDWYGTLHLIAVFDRPLTDDEVEQNFQAGY